MQDPNFQFPEAMKSTKRWLVRPEGKRPRSAFEQKPVDYEPPVGESDKYSGHWAKRWSTPSVLAPYNTALSYLQRHRDVEGLTYVVHHFGNHKPTTRRIVLDWDKAYFDGKWDDEVQAYLELLGTYTSFSRSGTGAHSIIDVTDCPAFGNLIRRPVGECHVDVLCSNPVAVTGNPVPGYRKPIAVIPYADLQGFPFFEFREPSGRNVERPEWWDQNPLASVPDYLAHHIDAMEMAPAIEGQGGSQVLFAAACHLARHGIVGREAEVLLRCVPAIPPFDDAQIERTIECAVNRVMDDGEFNVPTPEFDVVGPGPSTEPEPDETDRLGRYGFNFMTAGELHEADLTLEYLVDGAFVGEGAMLIGGREKTFKTGIAADLLVSLATETPFLGHFPVLGKRKSVLFTAEIGMARAKTLLKSICDGRGLSLSMVDGLMVSDQVPSFSTGKNQDKTPPELKKLQLFLKEVKPEVAVFDPLYFAMAGASVGDMYEIGNVLKRVTGLCRENDVWPIFCHHAKKDANAEFEPMGLNDFYGAGVGAFARQWILLSHAEPFANGLAKLYATIGGSAQGARGVFDVTIDEGIADDLTDRRWNVTVTEPEGSATGCKISTYDILAEMEGHGNGINAKDLAFLMNVEPVKLIERQLRDLVKSGEVTMINKRFKLSNEVNI